MASWLGPKGEQKQKASDGPEVQLLPEEDSETIHIFTVASGHLYERLQKIMVLSALRQTKYAFWSLLIMLHSCMQDRDQCLKWSALRRCLGSSLRILAYLLPWTPTPRNAAARTSLMLQCCF